MSKATSCDDCRIVYGEHREEDIAPCPLHARAPALRDALRLLLEAEKLDDDAPALIAARQQAKAALDGL
jgi:hypothetical protein